jgi:hypothetical protein
MRPTIILVLAGIVLSASAGCNVLGPCGPQEESGEVVSGLSGKVDAGMIQTHLVRYDASGDENKVSFSWSGQGSLGGPHLRVYATGVGCTDFTPPPIEGPPRIDEGECRTLSGGSGGYLAPDARECVKSNSCQPTQYEIIQTSLSVMSRLTEYKLHVVGDPALPATYSISIRWIRFTGHDC